MKQCCSNRPVGSQCRREDRAPRWRIANLRRNEFGPMKILAGLKAAAKGFVAGPKAEAFSVAGKPVACPHCGGKLFQKRKASLNKAFSSLTNTEWLDHEASLLICASCSRVEWFYGGVSPEKKA